MTTRIRARRTTMVVGVVTTALLAPLLMSTPAFAATPLTEVDFTDGVTTGGEVDFVSGSDVSLVLNEQTTGEYSFTGCWNVAVGEEAPSGPATAADITWTAGTAVDTIFTDIDLTPEATTEYNIVVWEEIEPGVTCEYIGDNISFITMYITVAESMTLTGSPTIGSTVTVESKVPGSLVGDDFDLWVCPDQTIRPDDNAAEGENGDCVGPFIQSRTGDSTTFLLGFDPEREGDDPEFWQAACDQYFVVHDYPNGGHSNWIGPVDCSPASASDDPEAESPSLAETGASDAAAGIGWIGAGILLMGISLVAAMRRARGIARD